MDDFVAVKGIFMRVLFFAFLASCLLFSADSPDGGIVIVKGRKLLAEVARTEKERERALAYRSMFKNERCMFVACEHERPHPVHTDKFLLPFDVIWVDAQGNIVELKEHVPPCKSGNDCPEHGGTQVSRYYVYLAAGTVRRLKLHVGDRVQWDLYFADGSNLRGGSRVHASDGPAPRGSKKRKSSKGKRS
jgi:uncharacterized membrane protein (UPF0127 family)